MLTMACANPMLRTVLRMEAYILYAFAVHSVYILVNDDEAPLPNRRHGLLCQLVGERPRYNISEKSLQRTDPEATFIKLVKYLLD